MIHYDGDPHCCVGGVTFVYVELASQPELLHLWRPPGCVEGRLRHHLSTGDRSRTSSVKTQDRGNQDKVSRCNQSSAG